MEDLKAKSRIRYKTEAKNAETKAGIRIRQGIVVRDLLYATARRYGHLCSKYQEDLQINLREAAFLHN